MRKKKNLEPQVTYASLEEEIKFSLPHLFAFTWYPWAREFFESRNKMNLLCAGNQISKSSTQIRKCIHWATATELWAELWPNSKPNQFWYLYPSQKVVDAEWMTKWSQFLPQGRFKDHPKYGWRELKKNSELLGIQFNSGITLFFKTYSQKVIDLQSGSVHAMFTDEEIPVNIYDELVFRLTATKGYFHMVFTATIGQEFWRQALEPVGLEAELMPHAWKRQISLYDAMFYENGTPSPWTMDEIELVKAKCSTHEEVLRRVYGKFITPVEGRKYPTFDAKRHYVSTHKLPDDWQIWAGVDIGSGGEGHPGAIAFVAVDPKYREGRFFLGWRGDNIGNTTASDIMDRFLAIKHERKMLIHRQFYDQGSRDFKTISERIHEPFEAADKSHETGDEIINLLFKYNMVKIFDDDPELQKFGSEIATIKKSTPKKRRKDDLVDAFRYAITQIPWDMDIIERPYIDAIKQPTIQEKTLNEQLKEDRQKAAENHRQGSCYSDEVEAEFAELNELYGN